MTVPNQSPVTYAYDAASRLTSITQSASVVQFAYDAASRRTTLTLPNGLSTEYGYDAASHLTALTYKLGTTTLGDLQYLYDAGGNRIQVAGSWARTGLPSAVASASYNANNQQLTFGSQSQAYDLNGNLTSDGTDTYTWDARNRLATVTGPVSASFVYDAAGRRTRKIINGTPTDFVYDAMNPVQEQSGSTLTDLLTGLSVDEYFRRVDATNTAFVVGDALGSVVVLADGSGTLSTAYTYEPFGATTIEGTASSNSYDFTSRESDATGVKYYRARYYHPGRQRFISEDPIGLGAGDANLYAYVRNNPVALVDPTGLCDDPGGPGVRYCMDRFIPEQWTIGFWGDNRGAEASGNGYRMRISITDGNVQCKLGRTRPWVGPSRPGVPGAEVHGVIPRPLGGRKIFFHCERWNGWTGQELSPGPIVTIGTIVEDAQGNVISVSLGGTPYPAVEVWQYGSPGGQPVLLGQYLAPGMSSWNLNLIGQIPLR